MANRRNREALPEDQQPMSDSGELQRESVRRKPPPSTWDPKPQPPYVKIPDDINPSGG